MILFRPNENLSRDMIMRRARSTGSDLGLLEEKEVDVDDRLIGRVLEVECEWRRL